jgi:hypothetical protein
MPRRKSASPPRSRSGISSPQEVGVAHFTAQNAKRQTPPFRVFYPSISTQRAQRARTFFPTALDFVFAYVHVFGGSMTPLLRSGRFLHNLIGYTLCAAAL